MRMIFLFISMTFLFLALPIQSAPEEEYPNKNLKRSQYMTVFFNDQFNLEFQSHSSDPSFYQVKDGHPLFLGILASFKLYFNRTQQTLILCDLNISSKISDLGQMDVQQDILAALKEQYKGWTIKERGGLY